MFVNTDTYINNVLQSVGEEWGVDRSYLFLVRGNMLHNSHEWCAPNIQPYREKLSSIPTSTLPHFVETLRTGKHVVVRSIDQLKKDVALCEVKEMLEEGIHSLVLAPVIRKRGLVSAFVGFDICSEEKEGVRWERARRKKAVIGNRVGDLGIGSLKDDRNDNIISDINNSNNNHDDDDDDKDDDDDEHDDDDDDDDDEDDDIEVRRRVEKLKEMGHFVLYLLDLCECVLDKTPVVEDRHHRHASSPFHRGARAETMLSALLERYDGDSEWWQAAKLRRDEVESCVRCFIATTPTREDGGVSPAVPSSAAASRSSSSAEAEAAAAAAPLPSGVAATPAASPPPPSPPATPTTPDTPPTPSSSVVSSFRSHVTTNRYAVLPPSFWESCGIHPQRLQEFTTLCQREWKKIRPDIGEYADHRSVGYSRYMFRNGAVHSLAYKHFYQTKPEYNVVVGSAPRPFDRVPDSVRDHPTLIRILQVLLEDVWGGELGDEVHIGVHPVRVRNFEMTPNRRRRKEEDETATTGKEGGANDVDDDDDNDDFDDDEDYDDDEDEEDDDVVVHDHAHATLEGTHVDSTERVAVMMIERRNIHHNVGRTSLYHKDCPMGMRRDIEEHENIIAPFRVIEHQLLEPLETITFDDTCFKHDAQSLFPEVEGKKCWRSVMLIMARRPITNPSALERVKVLDGYTPRSPPAQAGLDNGRRARRRKNRGVE